MYNHNKAQQSKNRVHISWDILYSNDFFILIALWHKYQFVLITAVVILIFPISAWQNFGGMRTGWQKNELQQNVTSAEFDFGVKCGKVKEVISLCS